MTFCVVVYSCVSLVSLINNPFHNYEIVSPFTGLFWSQSRMIKKNCFVGNYFTIETPSIRRQLSFDPALMLWHPLSKRDNSVGTENWNNFDFHYDLSRWDRYLLGVLVFLPIVLCFFYHRIFGPFSLLKLSDFNLGRGWGEFSDPDIFQKTQFLTGVCSVILNFHDKK